MLIKWGVPFNGLSEITRYELQVETSRPGNFEIVECDQEFVNKVVSCSIKMSVLRGRPYNLGVGQNIHIRVRAYNAIGWSEWSVKSAQAIRVMGQPPKMQVPKATINGEVLRDANKGQFTVCW